MYKWYDYNVCFSSKWLINPVYIRFLAYHKWYLLFGVPGTNCVYKIVKFVITILHLYLHKIRHVIYSWQKVDKFILSDTPEWQLRHTKFILSINISHKMIIFNIHVRNSFNAIKNTSHFIFYLVGNNQGIILN